MSKVIGAGMIWFLPGMIKVSMGFRDGGDADTIIQDTPENVEAAKRFFRERGYKETVLHDEIRYVLYAEE